MDSVNGRSPAESGVFGFATAPLYPFAALVGQEEMRLALLLNAVLPAIGGVLIRGEKGAAKSTAVRGLAALLPELAVVEGCLYGCDPSRTDGLCASCRERLEREGRLPATRRRTRLVELPLGATEDRVLGTLDLEHALKEGVRVFEPGLLAAAHRGILYIDEVNLLPDHLVDALLDAAASAVNVVEREGISASHPARFLLVGTMNPEEGDLRPQLLDRFGLSVEVSSPHDPNERAEVIRRRVAFEADPVAFAERWREGDDELAARLVRGRALLPRVVVSDEMVTLIAHTCAALGVEGMRGDITLYKAAVALAALEGRGRVVEEDVRRLAGPALRHRRRRQPFEEPRLDQDEIDEALRSFRPPDPEPPTNDGRSEAGSAPQDATESNNPDDGTPDDTPGQDGASAPRERVIPPASVLPPRLPPAPDRRRRIPPTQARLRAPQSPRSPRAGRAEQAGRGRRIGTASQFTGRRGLALAATLRAAALHQAARRRRSGTAPGRRVYLEAWDLREPRRQAKRGALVLFVVDASGSMAARRRMAVAKGAVLALLQRAYQARDRVGVVTVRGARASLLLPPTASTERASRALTAAPTGGRTPLASALRLAHHIIQRERLRGMREEPVLVVISDGRANVADVDSAASSGEPLADALAAARALHAAAVPALVIDAEDGPTRLGLAGELAAALGGTHIHLTALEPGAVAREARHLLAAAQRGER